MNQSRVLLADDHRMVAEGLKSLLSTEFQLVGVVEDGLALIDVAKKLRPDVIIADITMPRLNGLDAMAQLKRDNPRVKVIFLTMHQETAYARRAMDSGASGFVLKHSAPGELVSAIRAALDGKTYLTPAIAHELAQQKKRDPFARRDPPDSLTPRQREILQLFAEGRSAKEVANALNISTRTVEFHKYQLMKALGLHNSTELTHFAIKHGIVTV
ncbi:MAG TPA: response regulator transcription factor [Verrucomicrobiota bacterium]|nr:response regulator transcription factor [Verrucomicrobiota bacterium]